MELTYDLKLTDLIDFYLHTTKQSKSNLRRIRNRKIKLFFMTFSILLILQWFYIRPISPINYICSLLIALLPVIFYTAYADRAIKRKFRKFHKNSREPNLFGRYQLVMRKDGLEEMVEGGQKQLYKWQDIKNIVQQNNHIYIYTNAIHAIIIPMRIFSTKDDSFLFINELKRHIKESTNQCIEVKSE